MSQPRQQGIAFCAQYIINEDTHRKKLHLDKREKALLGLTQRLKSNA